MAQQRLLVVIEESTLHISASVHYGLWTTGAFVRNYFVLLLNLQILGHSIQQICCYMDCLYKV